MKFAIVGNNKHQKPAKGIKGVCPFCGETLVSRCGNIRMHHWAHLSDYLDDFNKPKLCWTPVNSEYRFAVIDAGIYVNNGVFMITGEHLNTLCSILNSNLFIYYFNLLLSTGYQYGSKDIFADLPINIKLVTKNNLSDLDIFEAYHLSEEEQAWISASLK